MSERTGDRPDETPIATQTRVPREPSGNELSDEATVEESDEASIVTITRVAPPE